MIYMFKDRGWGHHYLLVRAADLDEAWRVASDAGIYQDCADVTQFDAVGPPSVLWEYEYSPDSPREID